VTTKTVVVVRREAGSWQAETAASGVVHQARSLGALDRRVRELLGDEPVDYRFRTGDAELDRLVRQMRAARSAVRRHEDTVRRLTARVLRLPSGMSQRDLAVLLGLSYQRVHQLIARHDDGGGRA
jgi:hypothetical protein